MGIAYAYATPWRSRSTHHFAVEVTVYLTQGILARALELTFTWR
jgi:L-amino acid N-acyltransferase YncA